MTIDAALKFRQKYIDQGGRDFTKPAHFELDPSGFFEPHVEVVKILKSDFHELEGGKTLWFRKETLDNIASAAGLSYADVDTPKHVRGEPFVGRCRPITQGPDGQPIMGDVAEYEFDPELRAEEDMLRAQKKAMDEGRSLTYTDIDKRLKVLAYEKVGLQRANTGARSRATIQGLGMQTGFKDLFRGRQEEFFIFSRIIINVKNKLVAEAQLAALSGNSAKLYGPERQIAATVSRAGDVEHGGLDLGADVETVQQPQETRHQFLRRHLGVIAQKYAHIINDAKTSKMFLDASMNENENEQRLEDWYKRVIDHLGKNSIDYHMENPE